MEPTRGGEEVEVGVVKWILWFTQVTATIDGGGGEVEKLGLGQRQGGRNRKIFMLPVEPRDCGEVIRRYNGMAKETETRSLCLK